MTKFFLSFVLFLSVFMLGCENGEEATYTTITFENVATESLANSIYGNNLYGGQYPGYHDVIGDLEIALFGENFYEGGIVLSQWNDTETPGFINQCSVYFKDVVTGFGGNNGSKTFAVHYGSDNTQFLYGSDTRTFMGFKTDGTEKVIDHFFVNNSTYAALTMMEGDSFTSAFSYGNHDWFKLIITGIDKNSNETGEIEFFLADFRTSKSKGIVTEWTKVDLSPLGKVHGLRFDIESSIENEYGSSVPTYFCFDDVAIRD